MSNSRPSKKSRTCSPQWLTHLFNSFAFSRTSSSIPRKNPATSANDIPCLRVSVKNNRSAFDHGSLVFVFKCPSGRSVIIES
jgi:hypothetical protein